MFAKKVFRPLAPASRNHYVFSHSNLESSKRRWQGMADRLGIILSVLCMIHCVLTPVLLISLPALQLFFLREEFHAYLAVIIPITCLMAFIPGYRSHRRNEVFVWAAGGLALILSALFVPHTPKAIWFESTLSISGGVLLIRAHLLNRKLSACSRSSCHH